MTRGLERFTRSFEKSRIPFLLAEVVTDGRGEMVDLICRYANAPAAALLDLAAAGLKGRRYSEERSAPPPALLAPMAQVAFGGSSASIRYETVLGRHLTLTCYQPMYGLCGCILEEPERGGAPDADLSGAAELADGAAVLEVGRGGTRILSCTDRLCELAGYSRRDFFGRFLSDFSRLVHPEDWPDLLQALLDAAQAGRSVRHIFRLQCRDGQSRWTELRGAALSSRPGECVFRTVFLDSDAAHRAQEQLQAAVRELSAAQERFRQLFDDLPGGCCLFQFPAEGEKPRLLRVSRGFRELVGYSEGELLRRISADPLWHVHPDDREGLEQALRAASGACQPLCHTFRLRCRNGEYRCLTVSAQGRKQPDGGILAYAAYDDVTRERAAADEARFHAELCDLLLRRAGSVGLDYDPLTDTAVLEWYDDTGRRRNRTVSGYRTALSSAVHPDDRALVAEKVDEALSKPQKGSFIYRADYRGDAYRWYQASYASLADDRGDLCRLLAKAEDISERKAAEARFLSQAQRRKRLSPDALAFFRLDLTADCMLDARSSNRAVRRMLFANSAEECLAHLAEQLVDPQQEKRFSALFSRRALLDAFFAGGFHVAPPLLLRTGTEEPAVLAAAELAENPENRHVEAFCSLLRREPESVPRKEDGKPETAPE